MLNRKYLYLLIIPNFAFAFDFNQLWLNNNQQGYQLLQKQEYTEAANKFDDSQWKGIAYYKAQQYDKAYEQFSKDKSALGYYNQGNALAQLHKYQDAIDAYNQSLKINKNNQDAIDNIELLKKLLEQDKQNQEDNKNNQKQQQDNKNSQEKNDQNNKDSSNEQQDSNSKDKQQQSDNDKKQQNQQSSGNKEPNKQDKQQSDNQQRLPKDENKPEPKQQSNNQANQAKNEPQPEPDVQQNQANAQLSPEQKQEQQMKAILSQIPDDPGGLLRNKFLRDYQMQQGGTQ